MKNAKPNPAYIAKRLMELYSTTFAVASFARDCYSRKECADTLT